MRSLSLTVRDVCPAARTDTRIRARKRSFQLKEKREKRKRNGAPSRFRINLRTEPLINTRSIFIHRRSRNAKRVLPEGESLLSRRKYTEDGYRGNLIEVRPPQTRYFSSPFVLTGPFCVVCTYLINSPQLINGNSILRSCTFFLMGRGRSLNRYDITQHVPPW